MFLAKLKNSIQSKTFLVCVCALVLLLLNWSVLVPSLTTLRPAGNDSVGHYEIGKYYADHIFPHTWGWVPHLFGGMPFPEYYPPLFFFITAFLYKIGPFSYVHVFQALVMLLTISIPSITALIARRYSKMAYSGWFAGLFSIVLMTLSYDTYGNLGITIQSTYGVGLVPQLLGFVCLLLWLYFFVGIEKSRWNWSFSILFLFLTFLSNAHIVPTACIIFATIFIYNFIVSSHKKSLFFLYFSAGFIPTLAVSFWYIPMLSHFTYMAGRSLGYQDDFVGLFMRGISLFVLTVLAMIIGWKKKNHSLVGFTIALLLIAISVFLHLDKLIPRLPVHTLRSLAPIFMLAPIAADVVIVSVLMVIKDSKKILVGSLFALITIISLLPHSHMREQVPLFGERSYDSLAISQITDYMKDKEGMVNVETVHSGRMLNSYLSEVVQTNTKLTISYNVMAESAISSFLLIPLRGAVSLRDEIMPVDSYFYYYRNEAQRRNDPEVFDRLIIQSRELGMHYFFVASPEKVKEFSRSKEVVLDKDFGFWKLFKTVEAPERVKLVRFEPILLFSEINFKKRDPHSYDYMQFQEGAYGRALFDLTFVAPHDRFIDTSSDLDIFSTLVISEYSYKDLKRAEERILAYAEHNTVVLLAENDPLFYALEKRKHPHIQIFSPPRGVASIDDRGAHKSFDQILTFLDKNKTPIHGALDNSILSANFNETSIDIKLTRSSITPLPILIKSSYYPSWINSLNGKKPYLASPTFMLVYAHNEAQLEFKTPWSVYVGYLVTLCAGILFVIIYKKYRFK